ncbi:MAG: penicillin-binding protein 2 [Gaiellaceae bacterium]
MALRLGILGVLAVVVFCALFFRLWALQVISGERYLENANNNQIRSFGVIAPRGSIVDRDGEVLVSNKAGTLVQIWPAALENVPVGERDRMLRRLARLLGLKVQNVRAKVAERLESDPLTPVTIDTTVDELRTAFLMEHQNEFPGVQISETYLRNYEQGVLASQILGYVGEINAEQVEVKADEGYRPGDRIGQTGLEAVYDTYLRGVRGEGRVLVDALGRITSEREFSQLPEAGDNIRLTIDVDLQRAAEDALAYGIRLAKDQDEWAANGGAIVAMQVDTGEILALASNPTFDPNIYVGRVEGRDLKRLASKEANFPTMNRAIAGAYPPGSTFKPFVALAAMQEGLLRRDEVIQCVGERVIDGQTFANWDPYKNEPMTVSTALANSCDTFFYDVALRFYQRKDSPLQRWSRGMGFGLGTGVDLGPEAKGLVPTPAWRRRTFKSEIDKIWTSGDSVQLSIGQGDMLVSPLQLTRGYAMIANGGKLVEPHLVKSVEEPRAEGEPPVVLRPYTPKPAREIGLDPSAVQVVQDALFDATHASYGTSQHVFGGFPVPIAGKTGTAEKFVKLPGFSGLRDQSWWCGYGPHESPEIAVCALIENGGHGGTAAAPAALKVFEKYFNVEPGTYSAVIQQSD